MNVLFYRYGSICEPDIIETMRSVGMTVEEITVEMYRKKLAAAERIDIISSAILSSKPVFVFSINFFPNVADVCHIFHIPYLCWSVDSPLPELFSRSVLHDTNRIFLFDRSQYEDFSHYNPECFFYLPLCANAERFDKVIGTITPNEARLYRHDISFVGSLYTEKNPLRRLSCLPPYINGYINGIIDASLKVYGGSFVEETVTPDVINALKEADASFYSPQNTVADCSRYVAAHCYLGMQAAETERIRTLNELARHFKVDLYTRSDTDSLNGVQIHGGVKTLTEMPKIFHLSKINLNMTIKPIKTGLPLRIFDIMGCGGFLMTNYQSELPEYFQIGTDLEAYASIDELVEKCRFYLSHDAERERIAKNGYLKVCRLHSYQQRLIEMLKDSLSYFSER